MKFGKILRNTAMASAIAVLAFGAADAFANGGSVATVGNVSASVGSTLNVRETTPIKFGNMIVGTLGTGDGTVVLTPTGSRSAPNAGTDQITLYNGTANASNPTAAGDDAGSHSPGFYHISGANNATNIYISFSVAGGGTGDLIDANHQATSLADHSHQVQLTGPVGSGHFYVDNFTIQGAAASGANPTYVSGNDTIGGGPDTWGNYVVTDGSGNADVAVGATLHTEAGAAAYADGAYRGTFNVMVSY